MEQDSRLLKGVAAREPYTRALGQALMIALLAAFIGFSLNHFRSDPLLLKADWSPEGRLTSKFGKNILISLDEAKEEFFSGSALFVDARSPELYREGHIRGGPQSWHRRL